MAHHPATGGKLCLSNAGQVFDDAALALGTSEAQLGGLANNTEAVIRLANKVFIVRTFGAGRLSRRQLDGVYTPSNR